MFIHVLVKLIEYWWFYNETIIAIQQILWALEILFLARFVDDLCRVYTCRFDNQVPKGKLL